MKYGSNIHGANTNNASDGLASNGGGELGGDSADQVLAGQFLVAMPGTTGPDFEQSVILVCAHTTEGAMGLVINHPLAEPDFGALLRQLNVEPQPPVRALRLMSGGPVDHDRGFVLHSKDWVGEGSVHVDQSLALTASLDILQAVAHGNGPSEAVLALGYAGWGPGQLDQELQNNCWLIVPASKDILFDTADHTKWRRALAALKVDPALLSAQGGHA
jgi:putative transcriptional regulator